MASKLLPPQQVAAPSILPGGGKMADGDVFPTFDPSGGPMLDGTSITLSSTVSDVLVCYTTDGSSPACNITFGSCSTGDIYTTSLSKTAAMETQQWKAIACKDLMLDSAVSQMSADIQAALETDAPVFDPSGGEMEDGSQIMLNSSTAGAIICFSMDGSNPACTSDKSNCTNGTLYTSSVTKTNSMEGATWMAIACLDSYADSPVGSMSTSIAAPAQLDSPVFSPDGGGMVDGKLISISASDSSAILCFTRTGSTPACASDASSCATGELYTSAVAKSSSMESQTWQAVACKSGRTDSGVTTMSSAISSAPAVQNPYFTPSGGPLVDGGLISLASASSGAILCFTRDGSTPTCNTTGCTSGWTYSQSLTKESSMEGETWSAVACAEDHEASQVISMGSALAVPLVVENPTFDPSGGALVDGTLLKIETTTSGAIICYTFYPWQTPECTSNKTECFNSTSYTGPIPKVSGMEGQTWQAIACEPTRSDSQVVQMAAEISAKYVVGTPQITVGVSEVVIVSHTTNATICYLAQAGSDSSTPSCTEDKAGCISPATMYTDPIAQEDTYKGLFWLAIACREDWQDSLVASLRNTLSVTASQTLSNTRTLTASQTTTSTRTPTSTRSVTPTGTHSSSFTAIHQPHYDCNNCSQPNCLTVYFSISADVSDWQLSKACAAFAKLDATKYPNTRLWATHCAQTVCIVSQPGSTLLHLQLHTEYAEQIADELTYSIASGDLSVQFEATGLGTLISGTVNLAQPTIRSVAVYISNTGTIKPVVNSPPHLAIQIHTSPTNPSGLQMDGWLAVTFPYGWRLLEDPSQWEVTISCNGTCLGFTEPWTVREEGFNVTYNTLEIQFSENTTLPAPVHNGDILNVEIKAGPFFMPSTCDVIADWLWIVKTGRATDTYDFYIGNPEGDLCFDVCSSCDHGYLSDNGQAFTCYTYLHDQLVEYVRPPTAYACECSSGLNLC
eukprot:NODE_21_length_4492_cov_22.719129_g19_i0.p1 GENE.NODE_21_length_4492_cov_22.719129_g19_i0~~NODE_21_length_4492_cov_22.719129_g19_i0.p1  ORF type:complete len:962 (+),score=181.40 NODE_21_length_4492_cov_22.719129_g19_i0:1542-4427(+)